MARSFLICVTVLLGLCCFTALTQSIHELESKLLYNIFKDWTGQQNRQYGVDELFIRFNNWKTNYEYVLEQNALNLGYELGMNDYADMSAEEFSALHLGLNVDLDAVHKRANNNNNTKKKTNIVNNKTKSNTTNDTDSSGLPKSVDWRKKSAVTSVKNQGKCGGCWAFSASGALEGLHAIKNEKLVSLSEQQMIDCASSYGNQGCNGGLMTNAFTYSSENGVQAESNYKYTASEGTCRQNPRKVAFRNTGHEEVNANDFEDLKAAVAKQPVSVGLEASSMTVQLFKGGVITSGCSTNLDHGVLIVGYDTAPNGQEYWIVKNSWGAKWGLGGYMHIAMGSQNKGAGVCGINMMASYPTL
jgi:xylem cysteine proteinase